MHDRWLSVGEIAEYLGVTPATVYNRINHDRMPAHRVGRLWKFKREEVDGWVQSGGASGAASGPDVQEAAAARASRPRLLKP
jgi:excisionase family DNA binding protein